MVVFELPATGDSGAARAVSLGSCRVRNPLFVLRDQGDLRILAEGPTPTHTAEEAAQCLAYFMGEKPIDEALNPFIFEYDHRPAMTRLERALSHPADVYLLEISDDKQFSYRGVLLNQNFVTRHFVQPNGAALLNWYREIARNQQASEAGVQAALAKLKEGGFRHDEAMADMLREIRLDRRGGPEITATVAGLTRKYGGRWIIVGPFTLPGDKGAVMKKRREFNQMLKVVSTHCGAKFFNPTRLLKRHGKDGVIDGGVSIYEYEESFYPTLGAALVEAVRAVAPPPKPAAAPTGAGVQTRHAAVSDVTAATLAKRAEAKFSAALRDAVRMSGRIGRAVLKMIPGRRVTR